MVLVFILMVLGVYYAYTIVGIKIISSTRLVGTGSKPSIITAMWLITGWNVIVNLLEGSGGWAMLVPLGLSTLWILVFYFFSNYLRRFPNAWPHMKASIMVMFSFYVFSALYGAHTISTIYDRVAVVNLVYSVIVFTPWISLIKERRKRIFGFGVVFFIVAISMKRGAIIAFPVMMASFMLTDAIIRKRKIVSILKLIFTVVLFFVVLMFLDQQVGGILSDRFSTESLQSGSGRAEIYAITWDMISQRDPWYLLVGEGSGAIEAILGMGAHNEWLQFLYNYGVVGALFYGWLCLTLVRRVFALIKTSSRYAPAYAMAVVFMLIVGMFGMIYFAHYTFFIMALFGTLEGLIFHDKRNAGTC